MSWDDQSGANQSSARRMSKVLNDANNAPLTNYSGNPRRANMLELTGDREHFGALIYRQLYPRASAPAIITRRADFWYVADKELSWLAACNLRTNQIPIITGHRKSSSLYKQHQTTKNQKLVTIY